MLLVNCFISIPTQSLLWKANQSLERKLGQQFYSIRGGQRLFTVCLWRQHYVFVFCNCILYLYLYFYLYLYLYLYLYMYLYLYLYLHLHLYLYLLRSTPGPSAGSPLAKHFTPRRLFFLHSGFTFHTFAFKIKFPASSITICHYLPLQQNFVFRERLSTGQWPVSSVVMSSWMIKIWTVKNCINPFLF